MQNYEYFTKCEKTGHTTQNAIKIYTNMSDLDGTINILKQDLMSSHLYKVNLTFFCFIKPMKQAPTP